MQDDRQVYNLKVPESQKNKEWYEKWINYIIPFDSTTLQDYTKIKNLYAVVNNDITIIKKELENLAKPLGPLFDIPGMVDREIVVYNKLYPKYMYLLGQYMKRTDQFDIVFNSDSANKYKTDQLRELINKSIEEKIQILLEQMQIEDPQEAEQYYQQMRTQMEPEDINIKTFQSGLEEFYKSVIDYFNYKFNTKRLRELSAKHAITSDRMLVGIVEKHGQPCPVVFNPLHFGFHKSPDEEKIEKGDYWWYKNAITITQAFDELQGKVSADILEQLSSYSGDSNLRPNKGWDIKSGKARSQYDYSNVRAAIESTDFSEKHIGQAQGQGTSRNYHTQDLIWKTYLEFKAYRQVIFYTYTNENNNRVTEVVPDTFEIPKDAAKVKFKNRYGVDSFRHEWVDMAGNPVYAEKLWIPRRYEVTRYGTDIFTNYREVPNQPINIDNPYEFELSVKGNIFSNVNAESISLVERAIPSLMQYIFVKNLQNKELAKYEGYIKNIDASQIPDALVEDADGNPIWEGVDKIAVARLLRRELGEALFDPTLGSAGLPNYQKTTAVRPEIAGAIQEIINMQQLLELIDREMGFQMLVPPQAEGLFLPNSNVQDNQQALEQGFTQAEPYYLAMNDVWRSALNEYLRQFRQYYVRFFEDNPDIEETFLNFVTPEGIQKALKITPELLDHEGVGLFIHDGTHNEQYRRHMSGYAQALAQNRGEGTSIISELIMSITRGDSPREVHKKIKIAEQNQEKRAQELEQMKMQAQQEAMSKQTQMEQMKHQFKLEEIALKGDIDKEIKAMDIYKFQKDLDQDDDGVNDAIESYIKMRKLQQDERKINQSDKKIELEKKKIKQNGRSLSDNKSSK